MKTFPFESYHSEHFAALDFLLEAEGIEAARSSIIVPRPDGSLHISSGQRRLWFLHQLDPTSPAYNIPAAVRLHGQLDPSVLEACLQEIVGRHKVLRTTFRDTPAGPEPHLHDHLAVSVDSIDLSELSLADRESRTRKYIAEQACIPFDLAAGPLMRISIARLDCHEHVLVLVMHHIVADAWSMSVLVNELNELYPALEAGLPSPLRSLPIQYADYSYWQWEQRHRFQTQLEFWRKQLHNAPQLTLPMDRPRPVQPSFVGAAHPVQIPVRVIEQLKELGKNERATLFMTLLAAFQILLSRYSQQTDIVVGTPLIGRNRSELEPLIGFFVNTIVLRTRWSSGASFRDVLRSARTAALQAYEHQDVPFDEVVRAVLPGRDISHNPLFQVMFSVETEIGGPLNLAGASIVPEIVETRISKFDLTLNLAPTADGLCGSLEYCSDLFDAATIERMVSHFVQLLESISAHPDEPVAHLPILSNRERQQLVYDFNNTDASIQASSLGKLFDEQALIRPDAVAVEFEGAQWSYAELNRAASRWAAELIRRGIGLEDRVAILMEPSFEMVVAVVAIIKAGATYVPLVPSNPDHRLEFILHDTQARTLLTQSHLAERLSRFTTPLISLDLDAPVGPDIEPHVQVEPDHLAYIIYTSGSTGQPKGIAVTHRAITRLIRNTNYVQLCQDDRVALASNFAFDAATFELWGALLNGSRLVGVPRDTALNPSRFAFMLRDCKITALFLTTALFNQIARHEPGAFRTVRHLLFGGEAVDVHIVRAILSGTPPARLLHVYGPTECTTFATWHEIHQAGLQDRTVPIGRPLSNTSAYVVDRHMELVPMGMAGELCLGGAGLARGYAKRPDLTACAFVPDPFSGELGTRLYRTGDLARWNGHGELEFLGRIDDQVKIRGFRIEPAEITATLNRNKAVSEATVIVREDVPGKKRLVAYVVTAEGQTFSPAEVREYLSARLPEYMVPSAFAELPRLPLNANGKVDRNALPPVADDVGPADEAPRDERERTIAQAWCSALHREAVGIRQNYFELGGDSITAIQIVGLLKREGWDIQVRDIFQHPTIERLTYRLQSTPRATETKPLQPSAPLTPTQHWFFEFHPGPIHHFNQSILLKCNQALDPIRLQAALDALWQRHDALRTLFRDNGTGFQQVLSDARTECSLVDLSTGGTGFILRKAYGGRAVPSDESFAAASDRDSSDTAGAIEKYAEAVQRGFNLAEGPLFKAVLFRCDDADRLLLVAHHLVVDGVSWRIVIEELRLAYHQLSQQIVVDLGPSSTPWQQWAFAIHEHAHSGPSLTELSYWRTITDTASLDRFPKDGDPKDNRFGDMVLASFQLSEDETRSLLEESGLAFHTEINDILLAGLARALSSWANVRSTILTLEGHGRDALSPALEVNTTVGWFTSLFPFRLECVGSELRDQIIATKEALRRIPRGGAGYGILRHLTPRELLGPVELSYPASMSFNYLGRFNAGSAGGLWELASENMGTAIAPNLPRRHDLDLTGIVLAGRLNVSLAFHPLRHRPESIEQLLQYYHEELVNIAKYCYGRTPEKTVVDFTCGASYPGRSGRHFISNPEGRTSVFARPSADKPSRSVFFVHSRPEQKQSDATESVSPGIGTTRTIHEDKNDSRPYDDTFPSSGELSQKSWDDLKRQHGLAATEVEDVCYLSPMQEGLFFHAMYDRDSRAYHLQMSFELEGDLSLDALTCAWRDLERRHAILRTAFIHDGVEQPIQLIFRERPNPITEIHSLPDSDIKESLKTLRAADLARGFDLARDPLSRLMVVRLEAHRIHLIWSCHHILVDGWSLGILLREFAEIYRARLTGVTPQLPTAPVYSDYLQWIHSLDPTVSRHYWTNYLQDLEAVTTIPKIGRTTAPKIDRNEKVISEFSPELTAKLRALAAAESVTLNHIILGIWALLLARYNGTREVVFGTIVSGRPPEVPGTENAVGLFINAIPVRTTVPSQLAFVEFVRSIRDAAIASEPHHYFPLAEIQALSPLGGNLISHLLIFENYPIEPIEVGDSTTKALTMRPTFVRDETHYDFNIVVTPCDRLHLKLAYNANVYSEDQIIRIASHWETVANTVVESPRRCVGEIDILSKAERETIVTVFNRTALPLDLDQTTSARIERNAVNTPTSVAIRCGNETVGYGDLNARSNLIAYALLSHGVKPGDRVGVLLKRSPSLVASILGVWKVRAAYVPIDPDYPLDQIQHILGDSRCKILLTALPCKVVLPSGCCDLDPHTLNSTSGPKSLTNSPGGPTSEEEIEQLEAL
jgi:amino acid adenylation domain-containing protein/non-ribosomal peptide synthase protein (TIGR01720 family)